MSTLIQPPSKGLPLGGTPPPLKRETLLSHIVTSVIYTIVSVVILGFVYPVAIWGIGLLAFPHQAGGSMIVQNGQPLGS